MAVFNLTAGSIFLCAAANDIPTLSTINTPNDYINRYCKLATYEMLRSGVPASIKLAQAIVESSWGASDLARRSNNHFGVKARNWNGDVVYSIDDDYNKTGRLIPSAFRKYRSVEESYIDHSSFLQQSDRYSRLFEYERTDYKHWASGLLSCGYSTDPHYCDLIINTVERYGLQEYDIPKQTAAGSKEDLAAQALLDRLSYRSMDDSKYVEGLYPKTSPAIQHAEASVYRNHTVNAENAQLVDQPLASKGIVTSRKKRKHLVM